MILFSLGEKALIFLAFVIAIVLFFAILNIFKKKKALDEVKQTLIEIAGESSVVKIDSKAFDFEMDYNNKKFLIKMIYHPTRNEININSKDYWQVNEGTVSSRKSGTQMQGVYDLVNFDLASNGYNKNDTQKLYVIYPSSRVLLKVINECEMEFIKPETDIYGCKVNNFTDLKENINKF